MIGRNIRDKPRAQIAGLVSFDAVEFEPLLGAGRHGGVLDEQAQFRLREQAVVPQSRLHLRDVEAHLVL